MAGECSTKLSSICKEAAVNSISISNISGITLEKAASELGEDPATRPLVIQELREKVNEWKPQTTEEKSLTLDSVHDSFLLMFLRARKFDVNKAFQLYLSYHMFRCKHSQLLEDLNYDSVKHVFDSGVIRVLDSRAIDGSKVICVYPGNWNSVDFPYLENFRATFLLLDALIREEETQVHGFSILYNFSHSSFMSMLHVARSEPITKGVLIELLQDAFPARFKGVHLVHKPWYVSVVLSVIKPFMKQKLRDRIHSHGDDYACLHRYIDSQNLPEDFGGVLESKNITSELFERGKE